jgi:hypothetical protein
VKRIQFATKADAEGEVRLSFESSSAGASARRPRLSAAEHEIWWRGHPAFEQIEAFLPTIDACEKDCGFKFNSIFIGIQKNHGRYNLWLTPWRGGRYKIEVKVDEDLELTRELETMGLAPFYDPGHRWYAVHVAKPLKPAEQERIEAHDAAAHL